MELEDVRPANRNNAKYYLNVIEWNEEGGPTDHDKHSAGQVVGDDIVGHLTFQVQPETGHAVVSRLLRQVISLPPLQLCYANLEVIRTHA